MARKRTIPMHPEEFKNYFLVDANVLAYAALPARQQASRVNISDEKEKKRAQQCGEWWKYIKRQLKNDKARVYVPDVCIAEALKVLAKWYFRTRLFRDSVSYSQARKRLRRLVSTPHREMALATRRLHVHDVATNRDIIIGVDRFFEPLFKNVNVSGVSVVDLILLAAAKYLIDVYDIRKEQLYILSCDRGLVKLSRKIREIPAGIDPTEPRYAARTTFKPTQKRYEKKV